MATGLVNQERQKERIDMLEAIVSIFLMTALMAVGAIMFVIVCAMIGWMVYTLQNGVDDD